MTVGTRSRPSALRIGCGFEVFLDIIVRAFADSLADASSGSFAGFLVRVPAANAYPGVIYAFYIIASRPGHL